MRSDIVPGGVFPDYELPDHKSVHRNAGDLSPFRGWNKRAAASASAA